MSPQELASGVPAAAAAAAPPLESVLAKKLAANEPHVRAQALRKLATWLRARSGAGLLAPSELMALWKGLFFCFWMSDTPLVQEAQAESLAGLLAAFAPASPGAWAFARGFYLTWQRQWLGLDRWRTDKFLLSVRRFLRATLAMVQAAHWSGPAVRGLSDLLTEAVMEPEARGVKPNLGFQMHVIDVYLEELAKVGRGALTSEQILAALQPFVAVTLSSVRDERLLAHVEERLFQHLMRQSDLGIAYDEYLLQGGPPSEEEEEPEGDPEDDPEGDPDEAPSEGDPDEDAVLDPRAGGVHVTLPQLSVDYAALAERLFAAGNDPRAQSAQRRLFFRLTRQFRQLAAGRYPLAADVEAEADVTPLSTRRCVQTQHRRAIVELAQMRDERLAFQRAMRAKKRSADAPDDEPAEDVLEAAAGSDDSGPELDDDEPRPLAARRRKSALAADPPRRKKPKPSAAPQPKSTPGTHPTAVQVVATPPPLKAPAQVPATSLPAPPVTPVTPTSGRKKKKKKAQRAPSQAGQPDSPASVVAPTGVARPATFHEVAFEEPDSTTGSPVVSSAIVSSTTTNTGERQKKKKLKKRKSAPSPAASPTPTVGIGGYDPPRITAKTRATVPTPTFVKKARSQATHGASPKKVPPAAQTSSEKKRLNFSLSLNKTQSLNELDSSMMDSPEIPFCSEKRPKKGLLKNKLDISIVNTPSPSSKMELAKNTRRNSKSRTAKILNRMTAHDFF